MGIERSMESMYDLTKGVWLTTRFEMRIIIKQDRTGYTDACFIIAAKL